MPFSRSRSPLSIARSAMWSCSPKAPDCHSILSTRVVLPWSTWATMATLRRSTRRETDIPTSLSGIALRTQSGVVGSRQARVQPRTQAAADAGRGARRAPGRRICWGFGLTWITTRAAPVQRVLLPLWSPATVDGAVSRPVAGPISGVRPGRPERSHIQARFIDDAQAEGADRPDDGGRPHRDGLRAVRAGLRHTAPPRQLHRRQGHVHLRRRRRPQAVRPLLRHRRRDLPGHPPDPPGPARRQGGQRRRRSPSSPRAGPPPPTA